MMGHGESHDAGTSRTGERAGGRGLMRGLTSLSLDYIDDNLRVKGNSKTIRLLSRQDFWNLSMGVFEKYQ